MEKNIKELERHANIEFLEFPEDWHRDSSIRRRTDEDAPCHELLHVGNLSGHHESKPRVQ